METVRMECEGSGVLPIEQLVPFQGALKTLSKENYLKLKAEMLAEGFSFPVFVWQHEGSNYIIDGHQRINTLTKMKEEGYRIPPIPIAQVKAPTYKSAKKKVLAAASVYGRIEDQGLYEFLNNAGIEIDEIIEKIDLPYVDLEKFKAGYGGDSGGGGGAGQDDVPDPPKVARTKLGDLYELGAHRLLCGDTTLAENVKRLMGDEIPDYIFSDPPYGELQIFNKQGQVGKSNVAKAKNYGEYAGSTTFRLPPMLEAWGSLDQRKYIIWGGNYFTDVLPMTTSWVVWDKTTGENQHSWFSDFELAWTNLGNCGRLYSQTWQGMIREGEKVDRQHPTQKPVELYSWLITYLCKEAKLIAETNLGSGSTLIACEKTGRKCYGMELDPIYCDVIVKRWEDFTGKQAVLIK